MNETNPFQAIRDRLYKVRALLHDAEHEWNMNRDWRRPLKRAEDELLAALDDAARLRGRTHQTIESEEMDSQDRLVKAALELAEEYAELRQQQPRFPGPGGLWPSESDRLLHEYIQARDTHESTKG